MKPINQSTMNLYYKLAALPSEKLSKIACQVASGFLTQQLSDARLLILDLTMMIFKARMNDGRHCFN